MIETQVDTFSARLAAEMNALDPVSRAELLVNVGKMEIRMKSVGQDRAVWRGPVPETKILGAEVVVPTEQGERRGRVVCFGIVQPGAEFERSVFVHVQSSGTHHEVAGSDVRLASPEDLRRMKAEAEMAERLKEAASVVVHNTENRSVMPQKKRTTKDPYLTAEMLEMAQKSNNVIEISDSGPSHKIVGKAAGKRLYLFKTQLRIDISGFSIDHPAVRKITAEQAKEMHVGKVRGQFIFDDKTAVLDAFRMTLAALG